MNSDVPKDTQDTSLTKLDNRIVVNSTPAPSRKFGKQIQKRQLEIPEYAASFVDYKALKKVLTSGLLFDIVNKLTGYQLIKTLSATPVLQPQGYDDIPEPQDPQASLQANKASFFFRLVRFFSCELVKTFHT